MCVTLPVNAVIVAAVDRRNVLSVLAAVSLCLMFSTPLSSSHLTPSLSLPLVNYSFLDKR